MNKKRIAALIAASTMLLSTVPAFAEDTATGSAIVSSSGTVNAWDNTPIYQVTLPTANTLQFTVDPYGLLELGTGSATVDELMENASGAIVSADGSGAFIFNESSSGITVGIKLYVDDDAATPATLKADPASLATDSSTEMFLALVPSASKVIASGSSTVGYEAASEVVAITEYSEPASDTVQFYLDKADYVVSQDTVKGGYKIEKKADAGNGDGTMFKIAGQVNPKGDWTQYINTKTATGKALTLNAVFSYKTVDGDKDKVDNDTAYGFVSGSATTVAFDGVAGGGLKISNTTKSSSEGVDYETTFKKGTAKILEVKGKTVSKVELGNTSTSYAAANTVSISGNSITIGASTWSGASAGNTRFIKITFDDNSTAIIKVAIEV